MLLRSNMRALARWTAAASVLGAAAYAAHAGVTWLRYGCVRALKGSEDADPLLDQFMPTYEVAERHSIRTGAPAATAFAAACDLDLQRSRTIRAVIRTRELVLGSKPQDTEIPKTLLAMAKATGWSVLAEIPGREVVVGSVTQPWAADVVFHAIPSEEFTAFHKPGWVKIAWIFQADAISSNESIVRTETRVATTDPAAREKFRRYWAFVSPGIRLIRRSALRMVKQEAERRHSEESRAPAL